MLFSKGIKFVFYTKFYKPGIRIKKTEGNKALELCLGWFIAQIWSYKVSPSFEGGKSTGKIVGLTITNTKTKFEFYKYPGDYRLYCGYLVLFAKDWNKQRPYKKPYVELKPTSDTPYPYYDKPYEKKSL